MVSDWGGVVRIGGTLTELGVLNQGDIVRIGGILTGLGV